MSDLRNTSGPATPATMSEEIRRDDSMTDVPHGLNDNGGLSSFHHFDEEDEGSHTGKIVGGLVVALMLGTAGIYAYTSSTSSPQQVASSNLPSPSAPKAVASNTPPAAIQTAPSVPPAQSDSTALANSPYGSAPSNAAPTGNDMASVQPESKPVKTAHAHARKEAAQNMAGQNADESAQTAQLNREADQATAKGSVPVPLSSMPSSAASNAPADNSVANNAVTPSPDNNSAAPLPTPPAPPASSLASNGQSPVTPQSGTPAQDIPAAPTVTPEQPAPVTPAPATPAQQPDQAAPSQAQPQ